MSEPAQLIVKLTLNQTEYEDFLNHTIAAPTTFSPLIDWIRSSRSYNEPGEPVIPSYIQSGIKVRDWLKKFDDVWSYGASINHFEASTGTWIFAVHGFSENYYEYLEALNVFRQASAFKTEPTPNYCVIAAFAFGDGFKNPPAVLEIRPQSAIFITLPPESHVKWAVETLEKLQTIENKRD